jgi:hypothetical protein
MSKRQLEKDDLCEQNKKIKLNNIEQHSEKNILETLGDMKGKYDKLIISRDEYYANPYLIPMIMQITGIKSVEII